MHAPSFTLHWVIGALISNIFTSRVTSRVNSDVARYAYSSHVAINSDVARYAHSSHVAITRVE